MSTWRFSCNTERASVNAAALRDFIGNTDQLNESFIAEFCAGLSEDEAVRKDFLDDVAALDIREVTE